MPKSFHLMVLTPERTFYDGPAISVSVNSIDGSLGILADHRPMVTGLGVGELKIQVDEDKVLYASHSEGFLECRSDGVFILSQACEWPEEIDLKRAIEAAERARERLQRGDRDPQAMTRSRVALMRSLTRKKIKSLSTINTR